MGLEPTRSCEDRILSPARVPSAEELQGTWLTVAAGRIVAASGWRGQQVRKHRRMSADADVDEDLATDGNAEPAPPSCRRSNISPDRPPVRTRPRSVAALGPVVVLAGQDRGGDVGRLTGLGIVTAVPTPVSGNARLGGMYAIPLARSPVVAIAHVPRSARPDPRGVLAGVPMRCVWRGIGKSSRSIANHDRLLHSDSALLAKRFSS